MIVPSGELPAVLQWVGVLLPITPALEAFRIAAIDGGDFAAAGPVLGQLAVFAVVLVPFSVVVFAGRFGRRFATAASGTTDRSRPTTAARP